MTAKQHDAHVFTQFANSLGQHNAHCYARVDADHDAHVADWEDAKLEEAYYDDDRNFTYSTDSEWDHAEAMELGYEDPSRAWVSTDRDVWHRNPYYRGPAVPHPEDDDHYDDEPFEPQHDAHVLDYRNDEIPF